MLADTLEQVQSSPSKRTTYVRVILAALAAIIVFKTFRFFWWGLWQGHSVADFASFHIVARHAWLGDIGLAYKFQAFMKMQAEASNGATDFMPWTYPPQFNLLLAPLAFLPAWAAYFLFAAATLAFYLMTLRTIAGSNFVQVLVILFPAVALNVATGQNGLLTGALIGLVCINAQKRQVSGQLLSGQVLAGLALGAMIIKPHLAIAAGVYLLATRRWVAIATAAMVVLASSLLCTLVFGVQIWTAWLGAIGEATGFLEQGSYKLFRMISGYAALHSAGVPATGAFWGQTIMAGLALLAIVLAVVRRASPSFALGISALVSVMISPYAYDYDLPIAGIGLALLIPDLARLASARERDIIYGLVLLAGVYGMVQSTRLSAQSGPDLNQQDFGQHLSLAVGGLAIMALLAVLLRILLRKSQPTLVSSPEPEKILPHPARVLE